jgi:Ca2+:H+ antiporter
MPKKRADGHNVPGWWAKFPVKTEHRWLNVLLLAIPVAIGLHIADAPPLAIFSAAALGIIPLAGVMGEATEALAAHTGPTIGGILNATFGNATELIIAVFALRAGHVEVVKASLSGSIIGNILLVLGLSIMVGGIGREKQTFSRAAAGTNTTMLFIAVIALVMPAVYEVSVLGGLHHEQAPVLMDLSLWTSGVLIAIYAVSFIFVLHTHQRIFCARTEVVETKTSRKSAIISLALATVLVGVLSEMLVGEIEAVTRTVGLTEFFVGVIVVAIVGNAAEHSTAVLMARRDQMDLAITIAVGSSTQIALFVAPVLVFLSVALGHPMTLVFNAFEIVAIVVSVLIVQMVSDDGESTWFEGAQLLAVYLILAVSFYFVPG